MTYLNTGVDGTDEEDMGEDDEDADEDPQHERCTAVKSKARHIFREIQCLIALFPSVIAIMFSFLLKYNTIFFLM